MTVEGVQCEARSAAKERSAEAHRTEARRGRRVSLRAGGFTACARVAHVGAVAVRALLRALSGLHLIDPGNVVGDETRSIVFALDQFLPNFSARFFMRRC